METEHQKSLYTNDYARAELYATIAASPTIAEYLCAEECQRQQERTRIAYAFAQRRDAQRLDAE